jgi:hypothetical protein
MANTWTVMTSSSGSKRPGKSGLLDPEYKGKMILRKVKAKVQFSLEQAMKSGRGVEVQLYYFFNFGHRRGG